MTLTGSLMAELKSLPTADNNCRIAVQSRVDDILRPPGALGRLDEVAVWLAGWQRSCEPDVTRPRVIIFAGDHGVASAEDVSAFPTEVTGEMVLAFEKGVATVSAMAETMGAKVKVFDVGVGCPTANLRNEPAMSEASFTAAFQAGRDAVSGLSQVDLLVVGEMGIGNTTAAAAVSAAIVGGDTQSFVGNGTGVTTEALVTKHRVVAEALARISNQLPPLEILREVGGTELAAMAGAMFEARVRPIPMILDGYIASASAVVLHALDSSLTEHMIAGHLSEEPGHTQVLDHMGMNPLLKLDLRLGEASGALLAIPIVLMACRAVTRVATFAEWFDNYGGAK